MSNRVLLLILLLLLLIVGAGTVYYRFEATRAETVAFIEHRDVITTKSDAIRRWVDERQGDAQIWSESRNIAARVEQFLLEPNNPEHRSILLSRLALMLTAYDYESAMMVEPDGNILLSTNPQAEFNDPTVDTFKQALSSGEVQHTDFYVSRSGHVYIDWVAPLLREESNENEPVAAVILRVDAADYIFPFVESLPKPYATHEIYLMEFIGNEAIHITAPARSLTRTMLRHPIQSGHIGSVLYHTERESSTGISFDYRNKEVLFAHSQIEGTPWHLVAKVDRAEILAPVIALVVGIVAVAMFVVLVVGIALWRIFRQQKEIQKLELEQEKLYVAQRIEALGNNIPNGFVYRFKLSPSGTRSFLYISQGIEDLFGYTPVQVYTDSSLLLSLMDKETEKAYIEAEVRSARDLSTFSAEIKAIVPNEQLLWLHFNAHPEKDRDGSVLWDGVAIDITERKRAEMALQESEERFRAIVTSSEDAIISKALDGTILSWNPGAEKMFGYSADDMIGCSIKRLLPSDRLNEENWILDRIRQGVTIEHFETQWIHKDNTPIFIAATISPIFNDTGQVVGASNIARDITVEKQVERYLESQRIQIKTLVETIPDLVWLKDIEGVFLFCNHRFEQLLGATANDIIGKTDYDFVDRDLADFFRTHDMAAMQQGRPLRNEEWVTFASDGHSELLETTKAPLKNEHGNIIGVLGIGHDITARKKDEEELTRYRQHLEELVAERTTALQNAHRQLSTTQFAMDSAGIGIHWVDVTTGKILYVNQYAASFLDYTVEEMLEMTVSDIDSGFPPDAYAQMSEVIEKQGRVQFDTNHRHKNGHTIPVEVIIYYKKADQDIPARFITFVTDITRRKENEKLLSEAKQQAEAANHAKSTFLANMSHEIRTPMNAIIGFAHLIGNQVQERDQKEKIGKIIDSSKHLLGIINDILDLSKIEANSLQLETTTFRVASILDNTYSMMQQRIAQKGLQFILESDPRLRDLPVVGDPLRIKQVLVNYLSNAAKFTHQGSITLRATLFEKHDDEVILRFEVQDTGIGITDAQKTRLFNAFEQAEVSTTRKYGGTGLGLTISRRLAQLMDGETGVISEFGKGSTFWFTVTLKVGSTCDWQVEETRTVSALRQSARVLLVEDNDINQEVARDILNDFGLSVDVANHGGESCQKVESTLYDLILMDIQMPVMDGLDATRHIRKIHNGKDVPIVAMTANAFEEDRKRCLEAGMNDFISKPFEPDRLRVTLARWIPDTASGDIPETPPLDDIVPEPGVAVLATRHIDHYAGMKNTVSHASYYRLLRIFAEKQADAPERIRGGLQRNDRTSAEIEAHTLKGIASTLGMHDLRTLAASLERQLRGEVDEQEINDSIVALTAELTVVLKEVQAMIQHQAPEPVPVDLPRLKNMAFEMIRLLEEDDMMAYKMWEEFGPLLAAVVDEEDVKLLQNQIQNFDYSVALSTLHAILEQHAELQLQQK